MVTAHWDLQIAMETQLKATAHRLEDEEAMEGQDHTRGRLVEPE
jgi:hypothetical protein